MCYIVYTNLLISTQNTQQDLSYKTSLHSILTQCRGYGRLSYRLNSSSGLPLGIFGSWWLLSSGSLMVSFRLCRLLGVGGVGGRTRPNTHPTHPKKPAQARLVWYTYHLFCMQIILITLKFVSQICMDALRTWCVIFWWIPIKTHRNIK